MTLDPPYESAVWTSLKPLYEQKSWGQLSPPRPLWKVEGGGGGQNSFAVTEQKFLYKYLFLRIFITFLVFIVLDKNRVKVRK